MPIHNRAETQDVQAYAIRYLTTVVEASSLEPRETMRLTSSVYTMRQKSTTVRGRGSCVMIVFALCLND